MKKAILLGGTLFFLAMGLNSCSKCYNCSLSYRQVVNNNDSLITLKNELCSGGKEGAGANLDVTIKDLEANGYICTQK
jgi:hypothetical protein